MTESSSPCGCMIFDLETGNAVDSFDYTPEELERRAKELRSQTGDPFESPEWDEFVRHFREEVLQGLAESGIVMSLVPRKGEFDVKFAVELGAAIMLDKPIIAVAGPDRPLPEKLSRVIDRVITSDIETEEGREEFVRVLRELNAEIDARENNTE